MSKNAKLRNAAPVEARMVKPHALEVRVQGAEPVAARMVKPHALEVRVQGAEPVAARPASVRLIGEGRPCPNCGGTDTFVRSTRTHPSFVGKRMRHCLCNACGRTFKA